MTQTRSNARLPDVLIVGAGPTGLTLAADLARRGVTFRIIDKKDGPEPFWRAGNLWPRTQELLSGLPSDSLAELTARSLTLSAMQRQHNLWPAAWRRSNRLLESAESAGAIVYRFAIR